MTCAVCSAVRPNDSANCENCDSLAQRSEQQSNTVAGASPVVEPAAAQLSASHPFQQIGVLSKAVVALLGVAAVVRLVELMVPSLALVDLLLIVVIAPVFMTWLYRARINAEASDFVQRRSRGWAIGAWFVPFLNLAWPFQIVADIWRAGLPAAKREESAMLPGAWWACWLFTGISAYLANAIGSSAQNANVVMLPDGSTMQLGAAKPALDLSWVSPVFAVCAAVFLMIVVITITKRQEEQAAITS